jgi:peptide/nickel transport system permease protein
VARYLVKRVALGLLVVVIIMAMLVLLVQLVPGQPARIILGTHATPQLISEVDRSLGLDKPVPVQVWNFFWQALHGNLGTDFISQAPVTSEIGAATVNTAILSLASVLLAIIVGVPLGVVAAVRQGGVVDSTIRATSMVLLSMPEYVLGLLLLLLLAVRVHLLPTIGAGSLSDFSGYLERLILPAVALAAGWWAYLARLVRASVLETLNQPFVTTARAYGVHERMIRYGVVLKNALVPVLALFGLMFGYILSGTVFIEVIFERNGLGDVAVSALTNRDWPIVRASVLIYALGFIFGNLVADIGYRLLDPRLRVEARGQAFI